MPTPPPPDPETQAESLLAEFLVRREEDSPPDFEAFCAEHPAQAGALRELLARYERMRAALRAAGALDSADGQQGSPSLLALLKQQYGEELDPGISLEEAPESAAPAAAASASGSGTQTSRGSVDETVRRLREHSLETSRYQFEGELAQGGMGAILKVWDEDLRRHLAMKVILGQGRQHKARPRQLARFLEEAQITGQLDHPGIVPVHELGLDSEGRVYFTMKLVKGRDLKTIFGLVFAGTEDWNETRALGVLLKACEAMAYAHRKGVIHRDLKPANVMVGNFGEVYVMDWGLARVLGRKDAHDLRLAPEETLSSARAEQREEQPEAPVLTMNGDVLGTPAYMAPEQARGEIDQLGPRSDVYSMGAMLYHLLARHAPYLDPDSRPQHRKLLAAVLQGPPPALAGLRKDLPQELVAICEKAMAREAAQRYPDMLALAEDLRAYLEHRVVGAYETGAWAEARKWVQRNRSLAASIAIALLVIAGGATVFVDALRSKNSELEQKNTDLGLAKAAAEANAAEATRQKLDVLKLSAFRTLDDLASEVDTLWPADPAHVEACRSWIGRADALAAKLPEFRAALAELEQNAAAQGEENTGVRWWRDQMGKLIRELEAFADPRTGLVSGLSEAHGWGVARRLEFAAGVEERTLRGEQARERWAAARAAIASSPKYGGLELAPQLGLLPVGPDPQSGLWEFAHLQSGEPAQRAADGKLVLTQETGLVLVLIPGGTFWMGASAGDPQGRNHDPAAEANEGPVHEVQLSPFFLSKYEMTQGQWLRFRGANPSYFGPASRSGSYRPDLRHPVERINWDESTECLSRLQLALPTEAQWEYACRAGTQTPWWTGPDRESLRGKVNLADRTAARSGAAWPELADGPDWEDGWVFHAPVGSLPANAFGLHEVLGNVWEWCQDGSAEYSSRSQTDPLASSTGDNSRVLRGGSYTNSASNARSADRKFNKHDSRVNIAGLRPARRVEP